MFTVCSHGWVCVSTCTCSIMYGVRVGLSVSRLSLSQFYPLHRRKWSTVLLRWSLHSEQTLLPCIGQSSSSSSSSIECWFMEKWTFAKWSYTWAHVIIFFFLRENDTTRSVHTSLTGNGPWGGPFEEDDPTGKGHPGAHADWKRLLHRPGAVHQRGDPAPQKSAGKMFEDEVAMSVLQQLPNY